MKLNLNIPKWHGEVEALLATTDLSFYNKHINMFRPMVINRSGTVTWIRPGSNGICSSIPDPKGQLWYLPFSKTILIDLKLVT